MEPFTTLTGVAAPLAMVNVDTDMIIPKQFLKTIARTGLAKGLFYDLRHDENGGALDFLLDTEPYRRAVILIAGENFGCGSSREHAPWALLDFGIRCVIAPSFADIFFNNCFKNGILPIALPAADVEVLMGDARDPASATLRVELEAQEIIRAGGEKISFDVEPFRKDCLLNGLDDIALTIEKGAAIDAFEDRQRAAQPWLYG